MSPTELIFYYYSNHIMAKKWPEKPQIQPHEFSPLYREKKARIQESNYYEFIEFLNWVENVNKWKKKEDWKRLIDEWFNKYSDAAIVWLFNMFVNFKHTKPEWYEYEKILNEAKSAFKTEIYGENIVRQLFGRYGNYLKYIKRKNDEKKRAKELEEALKREKELKEEKEILDSIKEEDLKKWAEDHYAWKDRDIVNDDGDVVFNPEHEHIPTSSAVEDSDSIDIEDDGQLKIPFDFQDKE